MPADIFAAHGWPKLNPNSPTKGTAGVAGFLTQLKVPAPAFFAWVIALLETIDMLVAIQLVRRGMGKAPFMDPKGVGWEFEVALLAGALALLFTGPGAIALRWAAGW